MTDAPERIWAGVLTDEYRGMTGTRIRVWGDDPRVGTDDPVTEYIRADLVAALEAENQRLRRALKEIDLIDGWGWCGQEAKAALAAARDSNLRACEIRESLNTSR